MKSEENVSFHIDLSSVSDSQFRKFMSNLRNIWKLVNNFFTFYGN
jgi:hypothetical protein